jgi:hypothetical protein
VTSNRTIVRPVRRVPRSAARACTSGSSGTQPILAGFETRRYAPLLN